MHYIIGMKETELKIGGLYGAVLTASVDATFTSHCFTIHTMSGGGTVMIDSKKQTLTPTSLRNLERSSSPIS